MAYVWVLLVVLGVNLMPAFGPPTWTILVLYRFRSDLNPVVLVLVGALGAAVGRLVLGYATRAMRSHISDKRRDSLDALRERLEKHRRSGLLALFLFALSPLPSAQLFEAAGLTGVPLPPLTLSFFTGRLVSYSLYVAGASALKTSSAGSLIADSFTNPIGIALQVTFLVLVVLLGRIDWRRRLGDHRETPKDPPSRRGVRAQP
jgi:uncharacterized membrane protein YdjX (TVP38/TMEM64 family)